MGLVPWVLLAAVLVVLRENRRVGVLWIFIPAIVCKLLWVGLEKATGIPSEVGNMFVMIIDCVLIGLIVNLLAAERTAKRNRFVRWLLGGLIFMLIFCVELLNIQFDLGMLTQVLSMLIMVGIIVGIFLTAFPLSCFLCQKKFGPVRFCLWMAMWILISTMSLFAILGLIQAVIYSEMYWSVVIQVFTAGLILGGVLIAGLLPFEIVVFVSPFWRKRFEMLSGLKTEPVRVLEEEPEVDSDDISPE